MKKTLLFLTGLLLFTALHAQWVNDPVNNTFLANCSHDAGEIYVSTNDATGDTYVQWCSFGPNSWSPTLQRINSDGVPQWGRDGIRLTYHTFSSSSDGIAMTTTADGGVVSCFAIYDGFSYAVKLNADGTYAWGEEGVKLFDGFGFSRTEVIAGNDGGVWALGFDYTNLYLQYVNADGSPNPFVTITDNKGYSCMYGQLTLGNDNNVFVTYEKLGSGFYTQKQIFVAGYAVDGTQISPETLLMSSQTFQSTYIHHALSDGVGGGYVYIWHSGIGDVFNTYVFHFGPDGASTIDDTNGVPVHTMDMEHFYGAAYATVDPVSHDLIIAYEQTDSQTQYESKVYMNRVTTTGDLLWDEGILVIDNGTNPCLDIRVDAFDDEDGFMVSYLKQSVPNSTNSIIEAQGFDIKGDLQWTTVMSSTNNWKVAAENTSGFHNGQNITIWVNADNGGLYGQNILTNGNMGPIPQGCQGPENFVGQYIYDENPQFMGVELKWDMPAHPVEIYRLYRTDLATDDEIILEFSSDEPFYFDATGIGNFKYRLRALYAELDCGFSNPATTPTGEDFVVIEVTSVPENVEEPIVTLLNVYTLNGQCLNNANPENLSKGIYILKGLTKEGKLTYQKLFIP